MPTATPDIVQLQDRPEQTLLLKPVIRTLDQADIALGELAWMNARQGIIQGLINEAVEKVKTEYAELFHVRFDGKPVRLEDRAATLETALREFAASHRDQLLAKQSKKTLDLQFGSISYVAKPATIVPVAREDGKTPVTLIDELLMLTKKVLKFLKGLKLIGRGKNAITADQVIDLKPTINLARVKDLLKRKLITPLQLVDLGYQVTEESEDIRIKPGDYANPARSTQRPA